MKKIPLKKNSFDVYAFSLLTILVSLLIAWTNIFNRPTGIMVVNIYVQGQLVDTLPLDDDISKTYLQIDYPVFLGDITVEITDKKVRVEKETSPLRYCSIQGWVGTPGLPVVCAPNYFVVVIENIT